MIPSPTHTWLFSAQDLTTFLGCRRAAELSRLAHTDPTVREWKTAARREELARAEASGLPAEDPSITRGFAHERAVLEAFRARGLRVVELAAPEGAIEDDTLALAASRTMEAMQSGADVIFQATLHDGPWFGYADFLVRRSDAPSVLGDYCYEIHDTKLARSLKTSALLQLAHYGLILEKMQGMPPPRLVVVLGTGEQASWPFDDAAPYVERLREKVIAFHQGETMTAPEPVAACAGCGWLAHCDSVWGEADLLRVQRLNRRQRALLRDAGIDDIAALAGADDRMRPPRMAAETFERLRAQARVQSGAADFEVIRPQPAVGALADVPAPHPLDLYFDLEGDPYAAHPTLDYLWAFCDPDGACHRRWAHSPDEEREAFLWFLEELRKREAEGGDWRVYHYNAYETASLRRIAAGWPDEGRETLVEDVERFIAERFDDLYRRVEVGLRTRDGSTSLKIVEKLAGYDRTLDAAAVARGDDSIRAYELAIAEGTAAERRRELLAGIEHYNAHDVRATAAVHRWLCELGTTLGEADLVHLEVAPYEQSDKVRLRIEATSELEQRLLAAAEQAGAALPSGLSAAGARLLAGMLAWHRREDTVKWVDYFRLREWAWRGEVETPEERRDAVGSTWTDLNGADAAAVTSVRPGTEHESVLQDLTIVGKEMPPAGSRKKKVTYRITCRPGAWKAKAGDTLKLLNLDDPEEAAAAELLEHDAEDGSAVVATTANLEAAHALVVAPFISPEGPWLALMRLAEAALQESPPASARTGLRLLDRHPPGVLASALASACPPVPAPPSASASPSTQDDPAAAARAYVAALEPGELLPVQGPPGTGKTWLAAHIVADEIGRALAEGRAARIGVTANSHKVIDNLLAGILKVAREQDLAIHVAHVNSKPLEGAHPAIQQVGSGAELPNLLASAGSALVVGSTKYGWCRAEVAGSLDLLIIDEAGQVALADALSVVQAAGRVLAVGDPQQLAAPIQAAHDEEMKVSLLEHLIQGAPTISPRAGVFLDVSHRMHPALCEVVGRLAYASQLHASAKAAARRLQGPDLTVAGSVVPMRPGVAHVAVDGGPEAEVTAVVELFRALTAGQVLATDLSAGAEAALAPLQASEILIVAPHNAHVNRLRHALPGVEIGTVDKFQGREAHVVIYAMGRTAESPADVPFLYELNRINVALSRARLLAVVVTSPEALLPPVAEPEHLRLASRFAQALAGEPASAAAPTK